MTQRFKKPKKFDANLIVIGAGSAGLVSAYIAAAVNAKVILIERHKMGGDCLNTGCVPSKALIKSAHIAKQVRHAVDYGVTALPPEVQFESVMRRVHQVIAQVEPHDSIERYTQLGVDVVSGEAEVISPWEVQVNGTRYTARNLILATGATPVIPDVPGVELVSPLTSDTLWKITTRPDRLLVIGGGPIGAELAQAFARLGSQVVMAFSSDRLLPREDADTAEVIQASFEDDAIQLLAAHQLVRFEYHQGQKLAVLKGPDGQTRELAFDQVLVAAGRRPNLSVPGIDKLGLALDARGQLQVDAYLRTRYKHIFACGDLVGPYQFTHTASHQAWYACVNALFGAFKKFKVDYSVIPWCTFTDPEVATVGLSENAANAKGIAYEITKYPLDDLDRAIADGETRGFVKVLTVPGKDKILGVTIVGSQAGNLIAEYVLAMKHGLGLNKILGTIHIYPTMAEANKYVAGNWKRNHAPQSLLKWVAKFHAWRRG